MRRIESGRPTPSEAAPLAAVEPGSAPSRRYDDVAVVIPCLDEEATIGRVVADFLGVLPGARILVIDNRSTDATADLAVAAGATVLQESRPGKGYALVRGFIAAREAKYVVIVDGDDTYPAVAARRLLFEAEQGADMAIGTRLGSPEEGALSFSHTIGNRIFILLVRLLFGVRTQDLFSGYRVLSRRFLDLSALIARGFEIETELSMQALVHGFRVAEVPIDYRPRPARSQSKLRAFRDGYRILLALVAFFRDYRPLTFFGLLALVFVAASLTAGIPVIVEYVETGLVRRLPLAVLAVGLSLLGAMSLIAGLLLSSISRRAAELAALISRR